MDERLLNRAARYDAENLVRAVDNVLDGKPFVVGYEEKRADLWPLIKNIEDLMRHPRKNRAILYWLELLGE